MYYYAHMDSDVVIGKVNTHLPVEVAEYLEITAEQYISVKLGSIYSKGIFLSPEIAEPTTRLISKLEYMNRFTTAELASIYTAAKTEVLVEIWLEKFKLAQNIDLMDQRTIEGVHALEATGLIATGRAAAILA